MSLPNTEGRYPLDIAIQNALARSITKELSGGDIRLAVIADGWRTRWLSSRPSIARVYRELDKMVRRGELVERQEIGGAERDWYPRRMFSFPLSYR